MITLEVYHSYQSIPTDIQLGLTDFLESNKLTLNKVDDQNEKTTLPHYLIYLKENSNSIIGFTFFKLKQVETKAFIPLHRRIFRKDNKGYFINSAIDGKIPVSTCAEEEFKHEIEEQLSFYMQQLHKDKQILVEKWHYPDFDIDLDQLASPFREYGEEFHLPIHGESYAHYLQALDHQDQNEIRNLWKEACHQNNIQLSEYNDLKELFRYKEDGIKLYCKAKKHFPYYQLKHKDLKYLAFEKNNRLYGMAILEECADSEMIYHDLNSLFDSHIPHLLTLSYAIMLSHEIGKVSKLTLSDESLKHFSSSDLFKLGFARNHGYGIIQSPYKLSSEQINSILNETF